MPGRVDPKTAAERAAVLGALSDRLLSEFTGRFEGRAMRVLWEADHSDGTMSGFTPNYIKINAPYDPAFVNTITETKILVNKL
jgi:threonylcarbamoyladenosine tRNA methylthiotransferase MtaB